MQQVIQSNIFSRCFTVPIGTVADLTPTAQTSETLTFEWEEVPCGSRQGNITYYQYELYDVDMQFIKGDKVEAPITNVTIVDLVPCTSYYFRVAPVTQIETGPYSDNLLANTSVAGM